MNREEICGNRERERGQMRALFVYVLIKKIRIFSNCRNYNEVIRNNKKKGMYVEIYVGTHERKSLPD